MINSFFNQLIQFVKCRAEIDQNNQLKLRIFMFLLLQNETLISVTAQIYSNKKVKIKQTR